MASENRPCKNPALCGVQSHRPNTYALCMQSDAKPAKRGSLENMQATPSILKHDDIIPERMDTIENIRSALGDYAFALTDYEDRANHVKVESYFLKLKDGAAVPHDAECDTMIRVSMTPESGTSYDHEPVKEDGSLLDPPDSVYIAVEAPGKEWNRDPMEYGGELIPGARHVDESGVLVSARTVQSSIAYMMEVNGWDRGPHSGVPTHGFMPNWDRNSNHPMDFWPKKLPPASLTYRKGEYGMDASIKTKNGLTASKGQRSGFIIYRDNTFQEDISDQDKRDMEWALDQYLKQSKPERIGTWEAE